MVGPFYEFHVVYQLILHCGIYLQLLLHSRALPAVRPGGRPRPRVVGTANPGTSNDGAGCDNAGCDDTGCDSAGCGDTGGDGAGWDGAGWDGAGWDGAGWDGAGCRRATCEGGVGPIGCSQCEGLRRVVLSARGRPDE